MTIFFLLLMGCLEKKISVSSQDPKLTYNKSILLYDGKPMTGSVFIIDKGDTVGLDIFEDGEQEGKSIRMVNHLIVEERWYKQGKRVGIHRGWHANGKLKFQYDYDDDMMHDEARDWYADGKPYKLMHYERGYEAGMQTMWKRDGKLAMNYFARDGRNYGLTGVKSCENLWDSVQTNH